MSHAPHRAVIIRPFAPADASPVDALLQSTFPSATEAHLVQRLRASGELVMELIAERGGALAGYAGYPRLKIGRGTQIADAVGLAPLAVASSFRKQGIGATLMQDGFVRLKEAGETIVFVLGDADYYSRQGFRLDLAAGFISPHSGPHFLARALRSDAPTSGTLRYPSAFDHLA
jgi:putative acetyltransferase